jgi:hypothetical protein
MGVPVTMIRIFDCIGYSASYLPSVADKSPSVADESPSVADKSRQAVSMGVGIGLRARGWLTMRSSGS